MRYVTKNDIYVVANYHGRIMQGLGIVILLPIFVALIYQENSCYFGFIIASLVTLVIGSLFTKIKVKDSKVGLKHAMIVSSLAWLWATFLGALVMYVNLDVSFINVFF
ncbi:hypothetical protein [Methanobrevibacter sp. TMH8]|uniref:hypothetical protein n=1 Tax=Methanobrevibacter sp. TMH8 TaxID=2848611 RepID=UPI001CCE8F8D|nr:hypothetical protein [Methanobrevibacter sp. TMH8]